MPVESAQCGIQGWQPWLKEGDRLWNCPDGRYFFHYFHPQPVSQQIVQFWSEQFVRTRAWLSVEALQEVQ